MLNLIAGAIMGGFITIMFLLIFAAGRDRDDD